MFVVTTARNLEEAEQYSAKILMEKGSSKIFFEWPLLSIEQFPS